MSHETIKHWQVYRYTLPFKTPLGFNGKMLSERKGLFIQFEWNTGATGIGEIAPLPGFSQESLKDVLTLLPDLLKELTGANIEALLFGPRKQSPLHGLPPSLVFGIESALLSTPGFRKSNPIYTADDVVEIALNGLLNFSRAYNTEADAQAARRYEVVKIKISHLDEDTVLPYLNAVREANPDLRIIIDANQSWKMAECKQFGAQLRKLKISYVEEPFASIKECEAFFQETGISYALDEQWIANYSEILAHIGNGSLPGLRAVVTKPTLFGSIIELSQVAQLLADNKVQLVISSSFESGVGISTLSRIAYNLSTSGFAGLDTIKKFKVDILNPPLHLSNNLISIYPIISQPYSLVDSYYSQISPKVLELLK